MSTTQSITSPPRVLHGRGEELGPHTTRFALEDRTILHVLRLQAQQRPDSVWLVFDGTDTLTFGEAQRLTNRIANAIRDTVGSARHVGLMLRNQIEFMPSEMGAMAAPGVAVPFNSELRGPLLQSVIERSDVAALIVRTDLLDRITDLDGLGGLELIVAVGSDPTSRPDNILGVPVIAWDDWLRDRPETSEVDLPAYDDIAVIAFTSGTTGRAKGVVHTHHYWFHFSAVLTDTLRRTPDDVLTSPLPLHHGGALHLVANSSLHAGCKATLQSQFSPSAFWVNAARDRATYAFLLGPVAALIHKVCDSAPEHCLETIYCVPPPPEWRDFESRFRTKLLWQGWAMTEIIPLVMQLEQRDGVPDDTIGYPVPWMDYGVVDERDNMVMPGETGELVWRSTMPYGMFSGYYNDPQLTVDAFRNQWFHTGDAASYDPDGLLHFKGRMRDRIRRRGELVNAAELEYVAQTHDCVLEAAAYGVPAELGEEDIKVDIVLKSAIEVTELHAWLTRKLPKYMVPRYVELVDEFPRTPSSRIEKYKLSARPIDRPEVFDAQPARATTVTGKDHS